MPYKKRKMRKYEVGDLFEHKRWGYRAKIIDTSADWAHRVKYYKFKILTGPEGLKGKIREVPHIKVSVEFKPL